MRKLGFWDWLAYSCVAIPATILAADSAIKNTKNFQPMVQWITDNKIWNYAPLVLILIGGVIFLLRQFGLIRTIDKPEAVEPVWNENAQLTLLFDNQLHAATALRQDEVRFYYWSATPVPTINFETRQIATTPGYMLVFLALKDPTYVNHYKAVVIGGGNYNCEFLAIHPTGAMLRILGDLSGRTLDIRFSRDPIPLD